MSNSTSSKRTFDGILAAFIALVIPFPTGGGYYPVAMAFWDFGLDDIGHGTRFYWLLVAGALFAIYASILYMVLRSLRLLLAKSSKTS
jgi:hypothetical protein